MIVTEVIEPSGEGFWQISRQLDDLPVEFVHAGGSETFWDMHRHATTRTVPGDKRKGVPYTRARLELVKFWARWVDFQNPTSGSDGRHRGDSAFWRGFLAG